MKKILIAAGAAALLLSNEIVTMAILTVAAACAVCVVCFCGAYVRPWAGSFP